MKKPAFQFYPADFLSDESVVLMSNRELGCYIKLICYCWREGSIPASTDHIAKLCGEDGSAMIELWQNVSPCFEQSPANPSRLVHPRLVQELEKQEKHSKERAEAGSKGAKSRWDKEKISDSSANGSAIKEPMAKNGSSSSFSSSSSNKDKEADLLIGLPEQLVKDFLKIRKAKRLPLTQTALDGIKREASKAGYTLEQAIKVCCERGWASFDSTWQGIAKPSTISDGGSPASRRPLT